MSDSRSGAWSRAGLAVIGILVVASCGGGQGRGGRPMSKLAASAPPPPDVKPQKIQRSVSSEAKSDFAEAVKHFRELGKDGRWTGDECRDAAARFERVARSHDKIVEATYNAGVAYHQCNLVKDAEEMYQQALRIQPGHAPSLANLGEIYFHGGNEERGRQYWEQAVKADQKIVAARNNLAWLLIERMRKTQEQATWKRLEEEAAGHLSRALAVESENVEAYVLYALLYMEGSERNKSRLDLAKLLLDKGAKLDENFAPLHNAQGLLHLRRNNVSQALASFERAVALEPRFLEARMNVGNVVLGFRKYEAALEQFSEVLRVQASNYDALIGLGIAQRGLKKLEEAEQSYERARKGNPERPEAYFNLGVLYKDFRANAQEDLRKSQDTYRKAREFFQQFLGKQQSSEADRKEAQDNIQDCDKIIKQLDEVIRAGGQGGGQPAGGQ